MPVGSYGRVQIGGSARGASRTFVTERDCVNRLLTGSEQRRLHALERPDPAGPSAGFGSSGSALMACRLGSRHVGADPAPERGATVMLMAAARPATAWSSGQGFSGTVRNVVLVHGAYADGSSWSEVIERLQGAGLTATAVQNPLASLADDVAHTRRILDLHDGPVILAGHSFAGTVITEAGTHPRVAGLVYVAARPRRGRGLRRAREQVPGAACQHGTCLHRRVRRAHRAGVPARFRQRRRPG